MLIKVVELTLEVVRFGVKMQKVLGASFSTFNRRKTLHVWVSMQHCFEIYVVCFKSWFFVGMQKGGVNFGIRLFMVHNLNYEGILGFMLVWLWLY